AHGFRPIIPKPVSGVSESWHFDHPGSHASVYDYAKNGKYLQMARSAILSIGVKIDPITNQEIAWQQSALIRLSFDPGPIDGAPGERTRSALKDAGCGEEEPSHHLDMLLRARYPAEFGI